MRMAVCQDRRDPEQPVGCPKCQWKGTLRYAINEPDDLSRCPVCRKFVIKRELSQLETALASLKPEDHHEYLAGITVPAITTTAGS